MSHCETSCPNCIECFMAREGVLGINDKEMLYIFSNYEAVVDFYKNYSPKEIEIHIFKILKGNNDVQCVFRFGMPSRTSDWREEHCIEVCRVESHLKILNHIANISSDNYKGYRDDLFREAMGEDSIVDE